MTVIDLRAARADRAAAHKALEALAGHLAKHLISTAMDEADAAFKVASPIRTTDPEMSRCIYRFDRRRLRRRLRKHIGSDPNVMSWRPETIELACEVHDGRLLALIDERDAGRTA